MGREWGANGARLPEPQPEKSQQKTPTPSSGGRKGANRQMLLRALRCRSYRRVCTRPSAVPPRIRRIVTVPTRLFPRRAHSGAKMRTTRAESGHRYNGLARTDLLVRMMRSHRGLSLVNVLVGDLRRNGSGGTHSRVISITRSRSLGVACCAYSSQRASRHRPTVDDTIANGWLTCQAVVSLHADARASCCDVRAPQRSYTRRRAQT